MAFIDSMNEFSDAQALTATAISTNVYDLFSVRKGGSSTASDISPNTRIDIGAGNNNDIWLVITVNTTFTTGTSATLIATLETADDAGLTTNATVLATSGAALGAASLTKGTQLIAVQIPAALYRRYIGIRYTVGVGTFTAGAVDAYLTIDPQINRPFKSAFTVQ